MIGTAALSSGSPTGLSSFPLGFDLSPNYDALYYGFIVTSILFGITIVQAWIYVLSNRDPWPLRLLVGVLFLMDLSTTVLINQLIHDFLIVNFGNLLQFTMVPSVVVIEMIVTALIMCTVELFFASRIYILGRTHWIVPISIVICSLSALVPTLIGAAEQFKNHSFMHFASETIMIEYGLASSLSTSADIIASVSLSWSLRDSKTGFKDTDTLLQRLFQYFVTRGLLVAVIHLCFTITFLVDPLNLNWVPFHLSLSKLYVITIISLLNSRRRHDATEEHRMANNRLGSYEGHIAIGRGHKGNEGVTVSSSTADDVMDIRFAPMPS